MWVSSSATTVFHFYSYIANMSMTEKHVTFKKAADKKVDPHVKILHFTPWTCFKTKDTPTCFHSCFSCMKKSILWEFIHAENCSSYCNVNAPKTVVVLCRWDESSNTKCGRNPCRKLDCSFMLMLALKRLPPTIQWSLGFDRGKSVLATVWTTFPPPSSE